MLQSKKVTAMVILAVEELVLSGQAVEEDLDLGGSLAEVSLKDVDDQSDGSDAGTSVPGFPASHMEGG
jgi:hypothetical protein